MKLKKNSWNDISINEYYDILEISEDETRDTNSKNVGYLAILCETDEEEIWNLTLPEIRELTSKTGWLNDFDFDKGFSSSKVNIKGVDYDVCVDLQKMTIAQYIDFQTFYSKKDLKTYYGNILTCFLTPKGHKYNNGYDITELAMKFRDEVSITLANSVCFFFLKDLMTSLKATQLYLEWTMRKLKRKSPTKEIVRQMEYVEEKLASLKDSMHGYLS